MLIEVTSVVVELCKMLRYYAQHPSRADSLRWVSRFPANLAIVRFNRTIWVGVRNNLRRRNAAVGGPIKQLYFTWNELGNALAQCEKTAMKATSPTPELSTVERCAYHACACNVFKTSHEMKGCRGCWTVVYCNETCQRRRASLSSPMMSRY